MRGGRLIRNFSSQSNNGLIAVCFPGQGFQKLGMLIPFYKKYPQIVQPILEELDESLKEKISIALINESGISGPDRDSVNLTSNAQPLLLSAGYAIFQVLRHVQPNNVYGYFLGHSLGEYTAWTAAGVLPFYDSTWIVRERGKAMEKATDIFHTKTHKKTGMSLVMLPSWSPEKGSKNTIATRMLRSSVEKSEFVDIGNINSKSQIVLSGVKEQIQSTVEGLNSSRDFVENKIKLRTRELAVSGPFHSKIMSPGQETMRSILNGTLSLNANRQPPSWQWPPNVPIISNITAAPFQDLDEIKSSVINTLTETVRWSDSVQYANAHGCKTIVSIGPGRIGKHTSTEVTSDTATVYLDMPPP